MRDKLKNRTAKVLRFNADMKRKRKADKKPMATKKTFPGGDAA